MRSVKKAKSAEAILADPLAGIGVVDIDEHVFVGMAGEITGKDFYEFLLSVGFGMQKTVTHKQAVRSFAAIEPNPETRAVGAGLIQPGAVP